MQKKIGIWGSLGIALLGVGDMKGESQLLRLKRSADRGIWHIRHTIEYLTKEIQGNVARLERIRKLSPSPWAQAEAELVERYPFLGNLGSDTFLNPNTFPVLFFEEASFAGTESWWWQYEWRHLRHNIDRMRYVAGNISEIMDALERLVDISEAISPQGIDTPTADSQEETLRWDTALREATRRPLPLLPLTEEDILHGADPTLSKFLRAPIRGDSDLDAIMTYVEKRKEQEEGRLRRMLRQYLPDEEAVARCMATMNDVLRRYSAELDAGAGAGAGTEAGD
jgi:hypothetical protein